MAFTYKWIKTGAVLRRIEDNACIPVDPKNSDYAAFLASGAVAAVEDPPPTPDQNGATAADSIMSTLQFDINFNLESRLRVLEVKVALTKAQYRQALIDRWKVLNP